MRDPEQVAAAFDRATRRVGVRYAFVGGLAVSAWGQPRATQDADCLLELSAADDARLCKELARERLRAAPEDFSDARRERSHVTVFDLDSSFHVDCKLISTREEAEQIENARELRVADADLRIARPEDTVAFKLLFGTPQDVQDARSILIRQAGRLDLARLQELSARLGVGAKLRELLAEVSR